MGTLAPFPSCQEGACLTVREMIEGLKGHRSSRSRSKTELPGHTPHPGPARDGCLACPGFLSSTDPSVPQHLRLLETKTCCSLLRSQLDASSPESFLQRPRPAGLTWRPCLYSHHLYQPPQSYRSHLSFFNLYLIKVAHTHYFLKE